MKKLEIDSVRLAFGGRQILSNVYLSCSPGNIVGILGRNGSGKSCLLKILFGSMRSENRSVRYNEKFTPQLYAIPGAVHFLPQEGLLMDYLTISDLIHIFKLQPKLDLLVDVEVFNTSQNTRIGNLSGGARKMVEILTLLYADSDFVLLDEPFSYLSPVLVEQLVPHLRRQSQTKGIIITDHQYKTVLSTANLYYVLYDGRLRKITSQDELEKYGYLSTDGEGN